MTPFVLRPVEPSGTERTMAFLHFAPGSGKRGGLQETTVKVYPASPRAEELRRYRVHEGRCLGLRETSKALGISAVDLSSLERGSATLDEAEWDRLMEALRTIKES